MGHYASEMTSEDARVAKVQALVEKIQAAGFTSGAYYSVEHEQWVCPECGALIGGNVNCLKHAEWHSRITHRKHGLEKQQ